MSEIVQCNSCGSTNQLPFGKNSMFCAYCGGMVKKSQEINNQSFPQIIKSELKELAFKETEWYQIKYESQKLLTGYSIEFGGKLPDKYIKNIEHYRTNDGYNAVIIYHKNSDPFYENKVTEFVPFEYDYKNYYAKLDLTDFNIESFDDIISNYSKDDIKDITDLILDNNNIKSWENIEKFKRLRFLSIKNNKITSFPKEWLQYRYKEDYNEISEINLEENLIKEIPINYPFFGAVKINIKNNPLHTIPNKVIIAEVEYNLKLTNEGIITLTKITPKMKCKKCSTEITKITYENNSGKCSKCSKGKCLIATATMGSYDHPEVMELRQFRDNWILQQSWGENFVNWYYHYGEKVAKIIETNYILKRISYYTIVKPLVIISRTFLK